MFLIKRLETLPNKETTTTLETSFGGLRTVQTSFSRKRILEVAIELGLRTLSFVLSGLNLVNKTSGTSDNKTGQIVTLTVTNTGGITRGILRVHQVREVLILIAGIFHHDNALRIYQNGNRKSLLERRRIFVSTLLLHPTTRNGRSILRRNTKDRY